MPVLVSSKFHIHNAQQFVESLTEGLRDYGSTTITIANNSTTATVSSNVFSVTRAGDILMIGDESRIITAVSINGLELTIDAPFSFAITTQSFKTRQSLQSHDTYYLFIGRSTPWPVSDLEPSLPADTAKQTSYDYARDILALRKITANDLQYVVPRYNWTNGSRYTMYDHRIDLQECGNINTPPFYVMTSERDVFKCIYNGRTSADPASIAVSTSEPTIAGVETVSELVSSDGESGNDYLWKYLYTISTSDADKYLTDTYMPVYDVSDTLDPTTGDIQNDNLPSFTVFDNARNTRNGAIYQIVIENGGDSYDPNHPPSVNIAGDGIAAAGVAEVTGNVVTAIRMTSPGHNYSFANISFSSITGNGASATAIISPRNAFVNTSGVYYRSNHGISVKHELNAKRLMLYAELEGSEGEKITTANEYRRVGILKNPLLINGEIATGDIYDMTTTLEVTTQGSFTPDEIVYQPGTGAYGVVVSHNTDSRLLKLTHVSTIPFQVSAIDQIRGIGNGDSSAIAAITEGVIFSALPEQFTDVVVASGTTATIGSIISPSVQSLTGHILYVNHRTPISRSDTQTEVVRTILTF